MSKNWKWLFFIVNQNKPLFKLLKEKSGIIGRLILYKYAKQQDLRSVRQNLSVIIINNELNKTTDAVNPFT